MRGMRCILPVARERHPSRGLHLAREADPHVRGRSAWTGRTMRKSSFPSASAFPRRGDCIAGAVCGIISSNMPLFVPRDRKSLFRQFLAGMYDAVVITDPNGHILEINPRAEEHFGYVQDEVVDKPVSFFIPSLAPEIVQRIRRGLEDGRHMMIDAKGRGKDGTPFLCEVTVSIIDLMDPGDLVFTIRNVEKRRRAWETLRAKEAAFEASQTALFSCDREGRFTNANRAFLDMFSLENEDQAREASFAGLMPDDPLPANFAKALEGESSCTGIVAEASDGGDDEEVEVVLAPVRDGRKIRGVAGSVVKI